MVVGREESCRTPHWFACCTRPRHERLVARALQFSGIENYLPILPRNTQWSDRTKTIFWPAFPGYLFARIPSEDVWCLRATYGVRYVVGDGPHPTAIEDIEIDNVRRTVIAVISTGAVSGSEDVGDGEEEQPSDGDMVRVIDGPFCGVEGIVRERRGHTRLLVTVGLIARGMSIEIEEELLKKVERTRAAPRSGSASRLVEKERASLEGARISGLRSSPW